MKSGMKAVIAAAGLSLLAMPAVAETREYLREGDQVIKVSWDSGKLYCTRESDGFEMCHGMSQASPGVWKGPKMKHPDMPGFMTFKGTVVISKDKLKIEGCMLGGSVCDSEVWTRKQ